MNEKKVAVVTVFGLIVLFLCYATVQVIPQEQPPKAFTSKPEQDGTDVVGPLHEASSEPHETPPQHNTKSEESVTNDMTPEDEGAHSSGTQHRLFNNETSGVGLDSVASPSPKVMHITDEIPEMSPVSMQSHAHAHLKKLMPPPQQVLDTIYRASQFSPQELYKRYQTEEGVPNLVRRFEDTILYELNLTTPIPFSVSQFDNGSKVFSHVRHAYGCGVRHDLSEGRRGSRLRPWGALPSPCVKTEHFRMPVHKVTLEEYLHPKMVDMLLPDDSRERFGYEMYPYFDGYAMKQLADFQYETDNWLFGFKHPDLEGFIKNRFRNRSLLYWHLEGRDLRTLQETIGRFPGHFFMMAGSLDEPEFPPWLLNHPKLLKIFSVNVPIEFQGHPKLVIVPFGIRYTMGHTVNHQRNSSASIQTSKNLFASFTIGNRDAAKRATNRRELRRTQMLKELKSSFKLQESTIHVKLNQSQYTEQLLMHKFILSPPGLGYDTYRTWQTLYVGRVPLMKALLPKELYDDLPVVTVPEWRAITHEYLEKAWASLQVTSFNTAKLWYPWWVRHILRECLAVP